MSKQCDIVQDMLPLYVDEACSESTAEMVKEHLASCSKCNKIHQQMLSHTNEDILHEESKSVIERHEAKEKRKSRRKIAIAVSISSVIIIAICFALGSIWFNQRTPVADMLRVDNMLYIRTGVIIDTDVSETDIIGKITSSVSHDKKPIENGQSNFGEIGAEYAYYGNDIILNINDKWNLFISESSTNAYTAKGISDENVVELSTPPDDVQWENGLGFSELAPGTEVPSSNPITVLEDGSTILITISWGDASLYLEFGLRSESGAIFSHEKRGGYSTIKIKDVPAGNYYLFVSNSDAYSELPAYKYPEMFDDVSFNATGAMLYSEIVR